MLTHETVSEVEMLRWPRESDRREICAGRDVPCLLLVEDGAAPPVSSRLLEDWIRVPADELDLVARVRRLNALATRSTHQPVVDDQGVLRVGYEWAALSDAEASVARRLAADFGHLVVRDELLAAMKPAAVRATGADPTGANPTGARRPRTLDLQICRLRRRIETLGLTVSAVRGRGYVMESARVPRAASGPACPEEANAWSSSSRPSSSPSSSRR